MTPRERHALLEARRLRAARWEQFTGVFAALVAVLSLAVTIGGLWLLWELGWALIGWLSAGGS